MIRFEFDELHRYPRGRDSADYHMMTDVSARFWIVDENAGKNLADFSGLSIGEVAFNLLKWARTAPERLENYRYETVEDSIIGWITFTRNTEYVPADSKYDLTDYQKALKTEWKVGSIDQNYEMDYWITLDQLMIAIADYVERAVAAMKWRFSYEIAPILEKPHF